MKITKFTHACVRLEKDGSIITVDPGGFSEIEQACQGADAILITHEHPDHIDPDRVLEVLAAQPETVLYAPSAVVAMLGDKASTEVGARIMEAAPDSQLEIAGFQVRTFGGQHALIHPLVPLVANIGYLFDDAVYHPGDSLVVPYRAEPEVLLIPFHAPWSKVSEVVDFLISVRAPLALPVHDALLNELGRGIVNRNLTGIAERYGLTYEDWAPGDTREV